MTRSKNIRESGKIQLSMAFQDFDEGDFVSVVSEESMQPRFPKYIHGRTGIVSGKRGRYFVIRMMDLKKEKSFIIDPIHLKKIKKMENKNDKKK